MTDTDDGRLARSAAPTGAGCRRRSDRAGLVGARVKGLTTLLAERHARHLAGRAQTLQDARKPIHTDPSTIWLIPYQRTTQERTVCFLRIRVSDRAVLQSDHRGEGLSRATPSAIAEIIRDLLILTPLGHKATKDGRH
jgi:hypothetical protein